MSKGNVGFHQEIAAAAARPRQHLIVSVTTAGVQQLTTVSTPFEKAWVYGVKTVSATAAPTANASLAWLGEKDPVTGVLTLLDAVQNGVNTNNLPEPFEIANPTGAKMDLINYSILTLSNGDGCVVKYH